MSNEKKTVHRDSRSGQFTTREQVRRHPSTTETERVRVSPPKRSK
jgi:hypothetical protein